MGHKHHHHHHHHHQGWLDGETKWIAKRTLITLLAWIIGAVLIIYGIGFMISDSSGTFEQVIGWIMLFAGIFFIAFSKNLRKWFFLK